MAAVFFMGSVSCNGLPLISCPSLGRLYQKQPFRANMNELSIDELEQVNGGSAIAIAACVVACAAAAVKVADFVYDTVKGK